MMYEKLLAVLRHCGNENVPCEGCPVHNECGYFDIGAARNMREAADAIEELSKFSNSLQRLKAEGWCLERTKYDEYGATIQAMEIPEPPKEAEECT